MPKFNVQELKEIILSAEIEAENAEEAIYLYKRSKKRKVMKASEETHIRANEVLIVKE